MQWKYFVADLHLRFVSPFRLCTDALTSAEHFDHQGPRYPIELEHGAKVSKLFEIQCLLSLTEHREFITEFCF